MKRKFLTTMSIGLSLFLLVACGNVKEEVPIATTEPIQYIEEETVEEKENLKVYFFDVGQADSALIIFPTEETMLIDAGNNEDGQDLVASIKDMGISKIDYLVGTHPHEDHIGGMDNIIESFDIGDIYMPHVTSDTKTFEEVVEAIEYKNLEITEAVPGQTIYSDFDTKATILSPNSSKYENLNNYSVVIKLTYKEKSFLFQGDAEDLVESELLNTGIDLNVDVLKVGHHGSSTSSTAKFLNATTPEIAIISVGTDNQYQHPHNETIKRLQERYIKTYRTDLYGTIIVETDGQSLNVSYDGNSSAPPILNKDSNKQTQNKVDEIAPYSVLEDRVYITPTGKKYHKYDCEYLSEDFSVLTVKEAENEGYTACKVCYEN